MSNVCADGTCDEYAADGFCDDGGPGSEFSVCPLGSDCTDCGRGERLATYTCSNSCRFAHDGQCDEVVGASTWSSDCSPGTDCADCHPQLMPPSLVLAAGTFQGASGAYSLDGLYIAQGRTASGAPFYRRRGGHEVMYYDPDCGGTAVYQPLWIIRPLWLDPLDGLEEDLYLDYSASSVLARKKDGSMPDLSQRCLLNAVFDPPAHYKTSIPLGTTTWRAGSGGQLSKFRFTLTVVYPPPAAPPPPPPPPASPVPPTPPPWPPVSPEAIQINGFTLCVTNGTSPLLNGIYRVQGRTASGAPYFLSDQVFSDSTEDSAVWFYYDPLCCINNVCDDQTKPIWMLELAQPSTSAHGNLQQRKDCRGPTWAYHVVANPVLAPEDSLPFGTNTWTVLDACSTPAAYRDILITIATISPPPPANGSADPAALVAITVGVTGFVVAAAVVAFVLRRRRRRRLVRVASIKKEKLMERLVVSAREAEKWDASNPRFYFIPAKCALRTAREATALPL